jgi:hypothetical protein
LFKSNRMQVMGFDQRGTVAVVFTSPEDARLIAAAPDLLEVLEELLTHFEPGTHRVLASPQVVKARAAIAKAKGTYHA